MASNAKKGVAAVASSLIVEQALNFARDPQNRQFVADFAKPVADGAGRAAQAAAGKVKLPKRDVPFQKLEEALGATKRTIDHHGGQLGFDTSRISHWRAQRDSLRLALPLAMADEGKGRRQRLKDLQKRHHSLVDEVYQATVTGAPSTSSHE